MDDAIIKQLKQEQLTDFHSALLEHCKGLVARSRSQMQAYYDSWDAAYEAYVSYRKPDVEDAKAANRKEPVKIVVPLTRSQVLSFTTLTLSIYLQRPRFFEVDGVGPEDAEAAKAAEALLENDLRFNRHVSLLWQWLLDIARFGVGVIKCSYDTVYCNKLVKLTEQGPTFMGTPGEAREVLTMGRALEFQGNTLKIVSPYNFFPDPSVPLSDFQSGEFVASESWFNKHSLRKLEADNKIAGLEHVQGFDETNEVNRRRLPVQPTTTEIMATSRTQTGGLYCITEVQLTLVPADFMIDGKPMGPEKYPVKWNVWIANDNRIIKAEPLGYMHDKYTYSVAQLHPDTRTLCNDGLVGSIFSLQDVVSFLINSHITNVRKVIGDKLVVKTSLVEMEDLRERKPVIRVREDANDMPLGDIIQQLKVTDVTTNHINDAAFLMDMAQLTTGVTDNAQGVFHTGRRSAREASNVAQAIAARLRIPALQMHTECLEPLGRQMISNHQQSLSHEVYVRSVGAEADPTGYVKFIKVAREQLVGTFDFALFDSTTPGERGAQAVALGEMLTKLPNGFQDLVMLGYDPRKFIEEWLILQGIKFPQRFLLDPMRAQQLVQQILAAQQIYAGPNPTNPGQSGLLGGDAEAGGGAPTGGPAGY